MNAVETFILVLYILPHYFHSICNIDFAVRDLNSLFHLQLLALFHVLTETVRKKCALVMKDGEEKTVTKFQVQN